MTHSLATECSLPVLLGPSVSEETKLGDAAFPNAGVYFFRDE
jgi:hypothetical protein